MANRLIKTKMDAIKLRLQGASYSQIKNQLGVSKSTLSGWLKKYPLSTERVRELRDFSEKRIESYRNTMRKKKETRQKLVYQREKRYLLPLSSKELYIAGLFLYWGEGNKTTPFSTILSNSNPLMIKFFVFWLINTFGIPLDKMRIKIHLYQDMDEQKEINFWSELTKIPKKQFNKSYVKQTTLAGLTYKGFNHGTCNIMIHNRDIAERVMMGIEAISDDIDQITLNFDKIQPRKGD